MLATLLFIIGQAIINILIHLFPLGERNKYFFASLAPLIFGVLMLIYSIWSINVYDFFYPPDPNLEFRCGNQYLGVIMFGWIIGTPIVYFLQRLLNSLLFKNIIQRTELL